jgi:fucose 4-O-acetylase-like acetyltransferase
MIDIAKGLGILLIVLGHNLLFVDNFEMFSRTLTSFRLPFFFFVSGVTLSLGDGNLRRIVMERADAWLKPCAVVIISVGVAKIIAGSANMENLLVGLSFGAGFTLAWPPLWFLPHLWLVYSCCAAILINAHTLLRSIIVKIALLGGCAAGGFYLIHLFETPYQNEACIKQLEFSMQLFKCGLPFSADLLLITSFFFFAGHFMSARIRDFKPSTTQAVGALMCLALLRQVFPVKLDLNGRLYDDLLITPLEALFGIYTLLCLCFVLSKSIYISRFFGYFGRVSLFILIFHAPVQYTMLRVLPRWIASDVIVSCAAYVIAISASISLYYVFRGNRLLSTLMFAQKANVHRRAVT